MKAKGQASKLNYDTTALLVKNEKLREDYQKDLLEVIDNGKNKIYNPQK